jgi:hypothetical protein
MDGREARAVRQRLAEQVQALEDRDGAEARLGGAGQSRLELRLMPRG